MFAGRPLDADEVPAAAVRRARVGAVAPRDGRRDGRLPALGQVGHRAAPGALHGDAVRAVDDRRRAAPARADGAQGVEGAVRRRARGLRVALLLRLGELLRRPPRWLLQPLQGLLGKTYGTEGQHHAPQSSALVNGLDCLEKHLGWRAQKVQSTNTNFYEWYSSVPGFPAKSTYRPKPKF